MLATYDNGDESAVAIARPTAALETPDDVRAEMLREVLEGIRPVNSWEDSW
jgi:hypothetical protein